MKPRRHSCSRFLRQCLAPAVVAAAVLPVTPTAAASSPLTTPEAWSAVLDVRLVAADGEPSWTDGGFGKARFGGTDGNYRLRAALAEGTLVWQPRLSWGLGGTLVASAQHEQEHVVGVTEAFLTWKPVPRSNTRFWGRAGLFWPPVSLEHEGPAWSVADMITPSAINSWIGEEVKVAGVEATLAHDLGGGRIQATASLFGLNDTAGTLLAFRGWALHDLKATAFGHQPLPRLNDFMLDAQARSTRPAIELDDRPGFYAKLSWQLAAPIRVEAFYYDNRADPEAVNASLQWGWRTRFVHLATRVDLDGKTRLLAQALTGTTRMGIEEEERYWVQTRYRAAYARLSRDEGAVTLSGRIDLFDTRENGGEMSAQESESGWSATAAASWTLAKPASLVVEGLHIDSERGARAREGLQPQQTQDVIQAALRLAL